jgi:hypothetical protein
VGAAPGVQHGRQVGVPGVAVPDQDLIGAQRGQHPAVVDGRRAAIPGVHQGQVLGTGHEQVGRAALGPGEGLIGVDHIRGGQQGPHPAGPAPRG